MLGGLFGVFFEVFLFLFFIFFTTREFTPQDNERYTWRTVGVILHDCMRLPTIFQASNKLYKLNQNKIRLFLSFFIVFGRLSVV